MRILLASSFLISLGECVQFNVLANRAILVQDGKCTLRMFFDFTAVESSSHETPIDFHPCIDDLKEVDDRLEDIRAEVERPKHPSVFSKIKCSRGIGDGKYWYYANYEGMILTDVVTGSSEAIQICKVISGKLAELKEFVIKERKSTFRKEVGSCRDKAGMVKDVASLDDDSTVESLIDLAQGLQDPSQVEGYKKCINAAFVKLPKIPPPRQPQVVEKSVHLPGVAVTVTADGLSIDRDECHLELVVPGVVSVDAFQGVDPCIDLSQKLKKNELPVGWENNSGYVQGDWEYDFPSPRTLSCKRAKVVFARYRGPDTWMTRDNKICRAIAHKWEEVNRLAKNWIAERKQEGQNVLDCLKAGRSSFANCVKSSKGFKDLHLKALSDCLSGIEHQASGSLAVVGQDYSSCLKSAVAQLDERGIERIADIGTVLCVANEFVTNQIGVCTIPTEKQRSTALSKCSQ